MTGDRTSTVSALVREITSVLREAGVEDPAAEAREIIGAMHDAPKHWATLNQDWLVDSGTRSAALGAALLRAQGAPVAYAAGRAAFRHLHLEVNAHVLIPRPETELLVQLVLDARLEPGGVAVDVGTGSGAIALSLALEGRFDDVIAIDVSADAIDVARRNATRLAAGGTAHVEFVNGSLLAPVRGRAIRAVVSNPPYIAHAEAATLPASVRDWEPAVALFSGDDGLATTAELVRQAASVLEPNGLLALEVDTSRAPRVAEMIRADGRYHNVDVRQDLSGRDRYVTALKALE